MPATLIMSCEMTAPTLWSDAAFRICLAILGWSALKTLAWHIQNVQETRSLA